MPPSRLLRPVALFLCAGLLLQTLPRPARAELSPVITVEVGQPSIWSLGQAHYLLAQMHKRDRGLSTQMPTEADLNPNRANAASLEAIQTLLKGEAQFDQGIGVQNRAAIQSFQDALNRRNAARVTLEERRAERLQASQELLELNKQLARLQAEDKVADQIRGDKTPPNAQDTDRKAQIAVLTAERDAKKAQVDGLDAEIASLTTAANAAPAAPTLTSSPVSSAAGSLPSSSTLTKFMEKFADESTTPSLSASTALDNFVGMQYEIISKQLTLLRDEVGPDQRVIFLELPASIYTVDKWAENYIAQVEWKVTKYYDQEPTSKAKTKVIQDALKKEDNPACQVWKDLYSIKGLDPNDIESGIQSDMSSGDQSYLQGTDKTKCAAETSVASERQADERTSQKSYPVTLKMIVDAAKSGDITAVDADENLRLSSNDATRPDARELQSLGVRALEIIPQQSSLNVNEYHASVRNFSFLGVLKLISGFGAKVDYQQQKEMYDKFLQQKAFASGFGKGKSTFGWTFGPLPGSKRIEPGQRTTYAVLAVPRHTLAIELAAITKTFKRGESPDDGRITNQSYLMLVPGEATERFWIDSASYSSVGKGKRATVLIKGSYFSPQLGVLVNGVPLKNVISLSRVGSDEPSSSNTTQGVNGEYEIANSREIILSFSMGSDFIGTPTFTFVTPERSTDINYFPLKINGQYSDSLKIHSLKEPMFMEGFDVTTKLDELKLAGVQSGFTLRRLRGKGLLPGARIFINGTQIGDDQKGDARFCAPDLAKKLAAVPAVPFVPFVCQETTQSYLVYFKDPSAARWTVRYSQQTPEGFQESEFKQQISTLFASRLVHYQSGNPSEADLGFTLPEGADLQGVSLETPSLHHSSRGGCRKSGDDAGEVRVKCFVPRLNGRTERDFITVKVDTLEPDSAGVKKPASHFADVPLPVHPEILSIRNLRNGKPLGFANEDATVRIEGSNFKGVTAVLFGDKEGQILTTSDSTSLLVKVPKVEVPKGQAAAVPVLLKNAAGSVSAGIYTYEGERLPKVVISPYPYPVPKSE